MGDVTTTKLSSTDLAAAKKNITDALGEVAAAAEKALAAADKGSDLGFGGVGSAESVDTLRKENTAAFGAIQQRIENISSAMGSAEMTAIDLEAAQTKKFTSFGETGTYGGN